MKKVTIQCHKCNEDIVMTIKDYKLEVEYAEVRRQNISVKCKSCHDFDAEVAAEQKFGA